MMQSSVERPTEQSPDRARLETLLAGIAQGDRDAMAQLYAAVRGAVYAMALGILRDPYEAQDVTQDVFVCVWDGAAGYRPQGSPMAWLLTIARNEALMRLRRSGRTGPLDDDEVRQIPAPAGLPAEERLALQAALKTLSDAERQIVLLHAASGLKHREIGQILDMPLATVLSKYHRALKKLRTQLEGDDAL